MKAVVKKQQTVDALVESFKGATAVYLLNFQGITVDKDNALRKALAAKGVKYHAVKNTLLKRVLAALKVEGLALLFISIAVGLYLIIHTCTKMDGYRKLLEENEFSRKKKGIRNSKVMSAYWCIVTALYLGWSFITNDWHITWIVWVIAGVLTPVVRIIESSISKNKVD